MQTSDLDLVRDWLAGTYSNRQQAMDQPVWFIPVTLWYIPLPQLFDQGCGFFTEQINQHFPDKFYRSRVLQLLDDPLRLENYKLKDQSIWLGASQDQDHLLELTVVDLEWLPECTIFLQRQNESFHGAMGSEAACKLTPESTTVIQIEFDLTATTLTTLDRGIDQTTGQQTWGSSAGPYQYLKRWD